jgi:formate dehydrogenase iron-sulfur subunit
MAVHVDIDRCIGCRSCEVACQRVHGGSCHVRVHFVGGIASVPIFCHHCEEASCAAACFSGALFKEGDMTAFDVEKCTGCGLCSLACPFGIVWTDKIAEKCDLCDGRPEPTCVATCPADALSADGEAAPRGGQVRAGRSASSGGTR